MQHQLVGVVARLGTCAALAVSTAVAFAQPEDAVDAPAKTDAGLDIAQSFPVVVVVGKRGSLTSAQEMLEIVIPGQTVILPNGMTENTSVGQRERKSAGVAVEWSPQAKEGTNLLGTVRSSYYGAETRPQSSWANDTQISLTTTIKL